MRIGSLFSGGGGGDLGFVNSGHEIVFGCEIDPKARSVFRYHHPDIPIYNDVAEVTRERLLADGIQLPNFIMGGSPCQDLSVAGKRAGLGGERSGLFYEQCRIADEVAADWVCWENVSGAFSSNKGEDFAAVLGGLTGNTPTVPKRGWRTAGVCVGPNRVAVWRVLDAQNFGVPQRRRRVFVVAGPRALARRVVEVLFEPESGERDSPTRGKSWEDIAASTNERLGTTSAGGLSEISQTIQHKYPRNDLETDTFILETDEPLQPVVGTLAPGAHGSGASTVNGQDAYSGQLVPIRVWAGSAQQDNQAAPLLHGGAGNRTTDIDGATWVIEQDSNG
jgi:DNA-cytosine methyltransferase